MYKGGVNIKKSFLFIILSIAYVIQVGCHVKDEAYPFLRKYGGVYTKATPTAVGNNVSASVRGQHVAEGGSTLPIQSGWRMLPPRTIRTFPRKEAGRSKLRGVRACRTVCIANCHLTARTVPPPVCRLACRESGKRWRRQCSKLRNWCGIPCESPSDLLDIMISRSDGSIDHDNIFGTAAQRIRCGTAGNRDRTCCRN